MEILKTAGTESFFSLTPDRVLDSVEQLGVRCTGLCVPLASYENRVYEVELEGDFGSHRYSNRRVIKFYRPGRWSIDQIREEHAFMQELKEAEISVVVPELLESGETVGKLADGSMYFCIYPKQGGRAPEDLDQERLHWLGRLMARMHIVGARKPYKSRLALTPDTYGRQNIDFLKRAFSGPGHLTLQNISKNIVSRYLSGAERLVEFLDKKWTQFDCKQDLQRIHGDCHPGNLLWGTQGPFFLDFDDSVMGLPLQDFWLLLPGERDEFQGAVAAFLDGYEEFRYFNRAQLKWIEGHRALRRIHFSTWLARRWDDPAFQLAFPQFGSEKYWAEELNDLECLFEVIQQQLDG